MNQTDPKNSPVHHTVLAYLLAPWHLKDMPKATPEERLVRAAWCRDHCGTFAGRWMLIALGAWLIQVSPLGFLFVIAGIPMLALFFMVAFMTGIAHLVAQLVSQKRAGPPRIDPPVDRDDRD
ncbi:hypothetical protein M911_07990 [Ectothiorhodospira haloalkaliphila]|uniref:Uncharacterized protein n=1 Tax=Ectothiorhodospira haloalkaliphila TaxID=421628 RepID=W8L5H2_9GAMM|nr:hypothetical protein [Ectothiorhodospira haloalkaliphila]AHK79105.1 hypothetical protein M911_07990 [Ectothiorhodospira haloalkaliphila]